MTSSSTAVTSAWDGTAMSSMPSRTGPGLPLPHERDESPDPTAAAPDPVIAQAKHDIDAGMVDTDVHAAPGLDAKLRARLVPGPGGKPSADY
jgi:hypothetical protein